MSVQATAWALNQAVGDSTRKLVLICIADHAHADGTAAWPSVATMAEVAECSTRTVRRHLTILKDQGFLSEGDQRMVMHLRADRRPTVWDVNLRGDAHDTPSESRGDTGDRHGVTSSANTPHIEPIVEPPTERSLRSLCDEAFPLFWEAYPRHTAKKVALKAYESAVVRLTRRDGAQMKPGLATQHILSRAIRFAAYCEKRKTEPDKIPHAATWLNQDRWEDELPGEENRPTPGLLLGDGRRQMTDDFGTPLVDAFGKPRIIEERW